MRIRKNFIALAIACSGIAGTGMAVFEKHQAGDATEKNTRVQTETNEPGGSVDDKFFRDKVLPLISTHCHGCHGESGKARGGLRLVGRDSLIAHGLIVPGEPDASRLIQAVRWEDPVLQMPPDARMQNDDIEILVGWVEAGAPWPGGNADGGIENLVPDFDLWRRRNEHWAWQPVIDPEPPEASNPTWNQNGIDQFVFASLEKSGIEPAARADRTALVRRLNFDLTGLPPTPEEINAFVEDTDPQALEKLVDRLLASPRFGEKWASHWLDLVRYAESMGHEFDFNIFGPWLYRDYVIRALNEDIAYDRFVAEHLAGDLIEPRINLQTGENEALLGTGFWWLGEQTHSPVDSLTHTADRIDNQIDVFTKAFQGMTVSCARCHDHMFDAISQEDFYSLDGILRSSRYAPVPVDADGKWEQARDNARKVLDQLHAAFDLPDADADPELPRDGTPEIDLPQPGELAGWSVTGCAPEDALASAGTFAPGSGQQPVARLHHRPAIDTGILGDRIEAAIRSPRRRIEKPWLHIRACGKGARARVVVNDFSLIRDPIYGRLSRTIENPEPHWISFDLNAWRESKNSPHTFYLELLDQVAPDPAHFQNGESNAWPDDAWLAVDQVVLSDDSQPPHEDVPSSFAAPDSQPRFDRELWESWQRAREAIPLRTWALGMIDGTPIDEPVHLRGDAHRMGKPAPRSFLAAISSAPDETRKSAEGSGRLHLVEQICSDENPLTSRTQVNRVWHHLFGRGLVATPDNFGVLGETPSHPELLDWLAARFIDDGWSTKSLIRRIVLSESYLQSVVANPNTVSTAETLDPENRLIYRQNVRRVPAEAIRDQMLAVAGRLDNKLGGPPVPIRLTDFMQGRGRPSESGPLDGDNRRTVYISVRRNFLSPMLASFDRPSPFSCVGRRNQTNVPGQALILLNDPFVLEMAAALEKRMQSEAPADNEGRIRWLCMICLGKEPDEAMSSALSAWIEHRADDDGSNEKAWRLLCHAMFNLKAFIWLE